MKYSYFYLIFVLADNGPTKMSSLYTPEQINDYEHIIFLVLGVVCSLGFPRVKSIL